MGEVGSGYTEQPRVSTLGQAVSKRCPETIFNPPRRIQFGEGARPRAPRRTCQNPVVYSRLQLLNVLGFGNNPAAAGRGRDPSPGP
jgi:hypothetical protein